MTADLVYLLTGASLLIAVVLPYLLQRAALSAPVVLLAIGALIGLLPVSEQVLLDPVANRAVVEHITELTVIVALMGVGLALDRPLRLLRPRTWLRWSAAWRLLAIAMPLTIAGVALLGWWVVGFAPATALLLGAALAPTDPVLASDVQVAGPTTSTDPEDIDDIDETDEVRFALTSEAGLNDGLAFPFVYAAVMVASAGPLAQWGLRWLAWELVGKVAIGVVIGLLVGRILVRVAFRSRKPSLRASENQEPLLAVAAVLLAYGSAEVTGGYGFIAVFVCALTVRWAEPSHQYHEQMHQVVQRLERILTLVVLLLLGVALTRGLIADLTLTAALVAVLLVLVVRPLSALIGLSLGARRQPDRIGDNALGPRERLVTAFFGVRGIGSLYYLAYATGEAEFAQTDLLWSTVAFAVVVSVAVHGVLATPAMRWLNTSRGLAASHD